MIADFRITAPSTVLPVSIVEARRQLRMEGGSFDDTLIEALIWAAVGSIEQQYGLAMISGTVEQYHAAFPGGSDKPLFFRVAPLLSLGSVVYTNTAGLLITLANSDYTTGGYNGWPFLVPKVGKDWPSDAAARPNAVTVTYASGFGVTAAAVPRPVKQAILLMMSDMYQNREDRPDTLPRASESLLRPYYRYAV